MYLLGGEKCVDVFHRIEVGSIQRVLAGEYLAQKTKTNNVWSETHVLTDR